MTNQVISPEKRLEELGYTITNPKKTNWKLCELC